MDINQIIKAHADQPLPHQLLLSWLKDYKRPNDKIKVLKSKRALQTLKKGLYIAGPSIGTAEKPDFMLLANHILGPSYVSVETALSYHGLIPERVYEVASMTTKASRTFKTAAGLFTYARLPLPYYAFGLKSIKLVTNHHAIIASPEKALCDKIVTTPGLIRSINGAYSYIVDGLRIDELAIKDLNTSMIREWLPDAPKRNSLLMAVKMIENL